MVPVEEAMTIDPTQIPDMSAALDPWGTLFGMPEFWILALLWGSLIFFIGRKILRMVWWNRMATWTTVGKAEGDPYVAIRGLTHNGRPVIAICKVRNWRRAAIVTRQPSKAIMAGRIQWDRVAPMRLFKLLTAVEAKRHGVPEGVYLPVENEIKPYGEND